MNLEVLKNKGQAKSPQAESTQLIAGNVAGPAIDRIWTNTTGLSGLSENTEDAKLGSVIVRSGVNFVRGSDYSFSDSRTANPTAITTSGANTISIGDSPFSITPGVHVLAGGSGADTYKFNSQLWLGALIVDDLFQPGLSIGSVGDAIVDALIPQDSLDFSSLFQDLHFTVFDLSLNDIPDVEKLFTELGSPAVSPTSPAPSAVLVTPFDVFDPAFGGGEFRLGNLMTQLGVSNANYALAVGVENINGSRGENTFTFWSGGKIAGRIQPGFGGSLALDYSHYHDFINIDEDGVTVDLASSGIDVTLFPQTFFTGIELPDWLQSLFPKVGLQYGNATGSGGGKLGVSKGRDVTGTPYVDRITGSKSDNEFRAGGGDDILSGEEGNDTLYGEEGNDSLRGGIGIRMADSTAEPAMTTWMAETEMTRWWAERETTSLTAGTGPMSTTLIPART